MAAFDQFFDSLFLPRVYVKHWVDYRNYLDSCDGSEECSTVLFNLKDYIGFFKDQHLNELDFQPLVSKWEFLDKHMESMKKSLEVTQKEMFMLQRTNHPSLSFDKKEWLLEIMEELSVTKLQFIQLLQGILQTHESKRDKNRRKRARYLQNKKNRKQHADESQKIGNKLNDGQKVEYHHDMFLKSEPKFFPEDCPCYSCCMCCKVSNLCESESSSESDLCECVECQSESSKETSDLDNSWVVG